MCYEVVCGCRQVSLVNRVQPRLSPGTVLGTCLPSLSDMSCQLLFINYGRVPDLEKEKSWSSVLSTLTMAITPSIGLQTPCIDMFFTRASRRLRTSAFRESEVLNSGLLIR